MGSWEWEVTSVWCGATGQSRRRQFETTTENSTTRARTATAATVATGQDTRAIASERWGSKRRGGAGGGRVHSTMFPAPISMACALRVWGCGKEEGSEEGVGGWREGRGERQGCGEQINSGGAGRAEPNQSNRAVARPFTLHSHFIYTFYFLSWFYSTSPTRRQSHATLDLVSWSRSAWL